MKLCFIFLLLATPFFSTAQRRDSTYYKNNILGCWQFYKGTIWSYKMVGCRRLDTTSFICFRPERQVDFLVKDTTKPCSLYLVYSLYVEGKYRSLDFIDIDVGSGFKIRKLTRRKLVLHVPGSLALMHYYIHVKPDKRILRRGLFFYFERIPNQEPTPEK